MRGSYEGYIGGLFSKGVPVTVAEKTSRRFSRGLPVRVPLTEGSFKARSVHADVLVSKVSADVSAVAA